MAIEIIPKPLSTPQEKGNILFIISLVVLISVASCYFYLFLDSQKKSEELTAKQQKLDQLKNSENFIEKEKEILVFKDKIDNFSEIFKDRNSIMGFFDFLEKNTHIKVMWKSSGFSKTGERNIKSYKLGLSGSTNSFITLAQQIIVLKSRPEVFSMKLSSLARETNGDVSFGIEIVFNPDLFVYK
jgi:hypothetical protein